jgi:hypothetical protein
MKSAWLLVRRLPAGCTLRGVPETRCADWDRVKLRCRVIGNVLPGLVTVFVDVQEVEFDCNLSHWDPIAFLVFRTLMGCEISLRTSFVPASLRFPNAAFWLTVHQLDSDWAIYDHADASIPLSRGTRIEAGM